MNQGTQEKSASQHNKPPNDILLGLVMFVAFIIFMALWLHFMLPETTAAANVSPELSQRASYTYIVPDKPAQYRF